MTDSTDHKASMERLKASADRRIGGRAARKRLIDCLYGRRKRKTTAALAWRCGCIDHGMKVAVVQFIKGAIDTEEEHSLKRFGDQVTFLRIGEGYTWETQDRQRDTQFAQRAWSTATGFFAIPDMP